MDEIFNEEYVWHLGEDYDCETCGYTNNVLRLEDFGDGLWVLVLSVGCYGGESTSNDVENFIQKAEEIINECLSYEYFMNEDAQKVRKLVKQVSAS